MGMTITEKILARHTDLAEVSPGMLINARVDIALGNDITAPIAIEEFRKAGGKKVFDPEKVVLVPDHFAPNKDIASAEQCKVMREFAQEQEITHYYEVGVAGIEHALLPEQGVVLPGDRGDRRRQPHLHLRRPGRLRRRRGQHGSGRRLHDRRTLDDRSGNDEDRLARKDEEMGLRQGSHPLHHRKDRRGRGPLPRHGVYRRNHPGPHHGGPLHDGEHGDRGRRKKRHLHPGCRSRKST